MMSWVQLTTPEGPLLVRPESVVAIGPAQHYGVSNRMFRYLGVAGLPVGIQVWDTADNMEKLSVQP